MEPIINNVRMNGWHEGARSWEVGYATVDMPGHETFMDERLMDTRCSNAVDIEMLMKTDYADHYNINPRDVSIRWQEFTGVEERDDFGTFRMIDGLCLHAG